jgi:DNA-binding NarL/FixJ family response regulator
MIKVMVVDDYVPTLKKITTFVNQSEQYHVIASLMDGEEMVLYFRNNNIIPDIVILDIQMWKMDGLTAMDYLHDFFPEIKVIAFSAFIQGNVVSDMFAGGAFAFIWKENYSYYLTEALKSLEAGLPYIDPRIKFEIGTREYLMQERQKEKQSVYEQYKLTNRETEIVKLISFNKDYKHIYEVLKISPRALKNYFKHFNSRFKLNEIRLENFFFKRNVRSAENNPDVKKNADL